MAHVLTISYGGTTINLTDGNPIDVIEYVPAHGGDAETVVETIRLRIHASTTVALSAAIASLEKALYQIKRFAEDGIGDRLLINFQPDGYAAASSSEIIGGGASQGRIDIDPASLHTKIWAAKTALLTLTITRRNSWKGAKTQLDLDMGATLNNTSGLSVVNGSVFSLDAADVVTELPAPIELEFANNSGSSIDVGTLHIYTSKTYYSWVGPDGSGGGTPVSDYFRFALTTSLNTYNLTVLSPEFQTDTFFEEGEPISFLAWFNSKPVAGTKIRVGLSGWPRLVKYNQLSPATSLQTFDSLSAHPSLSTQTPTIAGTALAATNLDVVRINLVPLRRFVRLSRSGAIANASKLVYNNQFDNVPNAYYSQAYSSVMIYPPVPNYGPGITLRAGEAVNFLIGWDQSAGTRGTGTFSAKLYYYPRRRTL